MVNKCEISLFMFILKNDTLKVTFLMPYQCSYPLCFVYENEAVKGRIGKERRREKKSERRAEACIPQPEVVRESVRM